MTQPTYADKYETLALERSEDGVLLVRLHSENGPVSYGSKHHQEWLPAFSDIASDRANRVVVITGTGDVFMDKHGVWDEKLERPRDYDVAGQRQKLLYDRLLEIDVPVIGVVNGDVKLHAELLVLGDIVLAAEHAVFADQAHFPKGEPANDGAHIFWIELLGMNRAKYFLMTGQEITAPEALGLGFVNEVWPVANLMPRAMEMAHQLATYSDLALRYQRRAFADRWKRLFADQYGAGFGMMTEAMYYLDLGGANPWTEGGASGHSQTLQPIQPKRPPSA